MSRNRYNRAKDIRCPKCDTYNQHNQRRLQFVAEVTKTVNNAVVVTPEYLAVYCFTCGYKLGDFNPADGEDDVQPPA